MFYTNEIRGADQNKEKGRKSLMKLSEYTSHLKKTFLLLFIFPCFLFGEKNKNQVVLVNGAGASFPYILYSKWFSEYNKQHPSLRINYRSIGSGGGIRQLIKGTLDFGASDVPMTQEESQKRSKKILHIPTTLSAVAVTYNLPQNSLYLDSQVLAGIFSGKIKKWNDPKILQLNKKKNLPDQNIIVVYRADGSGTTSVFTEYLMSSQKWEHGKAKSINWPVGIGGKGNEGVLGLVQKTKGAIGYVSMGYALSQKLNTAYLQNASGEFIKPSISSVQKAAEKLDEKKSYMSSIVNVSNKGAYPVSSFSYLLVYEEMNSSVGPVMLDFIKWSFKEGQSFSSSLYYAPLPSNVIEEAKKSLSKIKILKTDAS